MTKMDRQHKVLIIKIGYSEFLDKENDSRKVSLGDVLRTTVLLSLYKEDHVTWLTDEDAFPLLEGNPHIDRLLKYDFTTAMQLQSERFDTIINLEKIPGICALAGKINAWRRFGFRLDPESGKAEAYEKAFDVLTVSSDASLKKENKKFFQELLFEMVGEKWAGEEYVLGYESKSSEKYDIGLNTKIGQKWPTKSWGDFNWDILERLLIQKGFRVTMQDKQGESVTKNLYGYMDWLNSCNTIVSNDSLGMHLGIVLKKKVLGIFGPTPSPEVYFYGRGKAILPEPIPDCLPCFKGKCERGENCMQDISPAKVLEEIENIFRQNLHAPHNSL